MPTLYLIDVYGCVEPSLIGPIAEADFDRVAIETRAKQGDDDALFTLSIDAERKPTVGAFSAGFFEEGMYDLYYTSADGAGPNASWSVYVESYLSEDHDEPIEGTTHWVSSHATEAEADAEARRLQDGPQ